MLARANDAVLTLDITTLLLTAVCVTALLGLLLLFMWQKDRVRALGWWGAAYLLGGFSVAIWSIEGSITPPLPPGAANALLFVACGMMWSAARLFHGRPVLWGSMCAGAIIWLVAAMFPTFADSIGLRIVLSSLIVSAYTFLTAAELWRERRRHLIRRWPALFVPILHGAVFLFPIPLASVLPGDDGMLSLASGWIAVFALEVMLYVVGTAFIVMVLSKERTLRIHKTAAVTDPLTGLFNRRGFIEAGTQLIARATHRRETVNVLMCDLDNFKAVNDRFGHGVGDSTLSLFAATLSSNMRAGDIVSRLGGEEFAVIISGALADGAAAAERVRALFEAAAAEVRGCPVGATVSIGIACGAPGADIEALLARADVALYRAKERGRNRVELADELVPAAPTEAAPGIYDEGIARPAMAAAGLSAG
jgi:diguanylate cyclase (GGDEF)-like protein